MLKFKIVNGQELVRADHEVISTGTSDLYAQFELNELYSGGINAYWSTSTSDKTYVTLLDNENKTLVPWEVLSAVDILMKTRVDHTLYVSLSDSGRTTTSRCDIPVMVSAYDATPDNSTTPTQSQIDQILTMAAEEVVVNGDATANTKLRIVTEPTGSFDILEPGDLPQWDGYSYNVSWMQKGVVSTTVGRVISFSNSDIHITANIRFPLNNLIVESADGYQFLCVIVDKDNVIQRTISFGTFAVLRPDQETEVGAYISIRKKDSSALTIDDRDKITIKSTYSPIVKWTQGGIYTATGKESTSAKRVRSGYILCSNAGVSCCDSGFRMLTYYYDKDYNYITSNGAGYSPRRVRNENAKYCRFAIHKVDEENIIPDDMVDNIFSYVEPTDIGFRLSTKLDKPEGIPVPGKLLAVKDVYSDGGYSSEWIDAPYALAETVEGKADTTAVTALTSRIDDLLARIEALEARL